MMINHHHTSLPLKEYSYSQLVSWWLSATTCPVFLQNPVIPTNIMDVGSQIHATVSHHYLQTCRRYTPQGLFLGAGALLIHACLNALVKRMSSAPSLLGDKETGKYCYTGLLTIGTVEEGSLKWWKDAATAKISVPEQGGRGEEYWPPLSSHLPGSIWCLPLARPESLQARDPRACILKGGKTPVAQSKTEMLGEWIKGQVVGMVSVGQKKNTS